jgi:hypothetical protein
MGNRRKPGAACAQTRTAAEFSTDRRIASRAISVGSGQSAGGSGQWAVGRLRSVRCRALWPVSDRATGRDRRSPFLAMAKSAHYGLIRHATDNAGDLRSRPVARSETGHSARPHRLGPTAHCLLPTAPFSWTIASLPAISDLERFSDGYSVDSAVKCPRK